MKRPILIDAQQMAADHPATFEAPTAEELAGLRPGFFAKVCPVNQDPLGDTERFWVEILAISDSAMVGRIDNDLLFSKFHGLFFNDQIEFEQRHIYQILKPRGQI